MFDFAALYEATSVEDAVRLRLAHPEALILAGGSDQLIKIREGKYAGREFISIFGLDELRGVSMSEAGDISIGALTCFSDVTADPIIQKHIPVLGKAVDQVGGPQIRNIGTIGGNVCNGITSADSGATLLAWDAELVLTGDGHTRVVPMREWYRGVGQVDIQPDEILTQIRIPRESHEGYTGSYMKYASRSAMDIAMTGCSVNVKLSADRKTVEDLRVAFGVAGPVPLRASAAEAAGSGCPVCEETVAAVAKALTQDIHPRTSWRASGEFRAYIAEEMVRRCFREAVRRGGGEL